MAKIAFILLCHKDAPAIIRQAERLTATGDCVAIHFDARAKASDYAQLTEALGNNPGVAFARKRVKCGWGAWSLVRATLNALEVAEETFPDATHFYMLSGDCMSVKSAAYAHRFLDARSVDYIESFDFFKSDWIKTGFKEERLIYRHWFNERTQKWLFYRSYELQKALGLRRRIPEDIEVMIGSQWWCLRRRTVETVLDFCRKRRDVVRFFATTWIPDETFFQTLVRHLVPDREIESRTLTFKMFSDYGMPVTFYNDQYDLLLSQDYLFARKISPEATLLKERLGALWASDRANARILELQCVFDDQYLVGHAHRVGLATADTPGDVIARMLPTLRHEFADESVRIRDAEFPRHWRLRQDRGTEENAAVLADFFGIPPETGRALAETPYLFAD